MSKVSIPKLHSVKLKPSNVRGILPPNSSKDFSPSVLLFDAMNMNLDKVVIMGLYEGDLIYFGHSCSTKEATWLLQHAAKKVLE